MDRGDAFRRDLSIRPAEEGSFVVTYGGQGSILQLRQHAFTNVSDLLDWLVSHAQAFAADKIADQVTHELTEGDVVREQAAQIDSNTRPRSLENILDSGIYNVRRTSAAEKMFPFTGISAADMRDIAKAHSNEPKPAA